MKSAAIEKLKFLGALPEYLNNPISYESAVATIRDRMTKRNENFLTLAKRAVFENPGSPYLPLFREAHCEYGDVEKGVKDFGVDSFLKKLKSAGVWIAYDEFKGRETLKRGNLELDLTDGDFDNPVLCGGIETRTGGSSGAPTRSSLNLEFLAGRAAYDAIMFHMLDAFGVPLAIWYPGLPAVTGVGNSLRYAKLGAPPKKWFKMPTKTATAELKIAERAMVWLSRATKTPLPKPEPLDLDKLERIVEWITQTKKTNSRSIVQTYSSQAGRICRAAREIGITLEGTLFIVGSEPLTDAKRRAIEDAGATVYQRYHATEVGSIAAGCNSSPDDLHVFTDTIAMVRDDDGAETKETRAGSGPLYFSSFMDSAPKILINVALGDTAVVEYGACGCLLGQLGFHTRIRDIRSFERVTEGAMAVSRRVLGRIAEEDLPKRFGGTPTDYQWAVGAEGTERVVLRVSSRVGSVDTAQVIEFALSMLDNVDAAHRFYAAMWREAGTIKVLREEPEATVAGKVPPII